MVNVTENLLRRYIELFNTTFLDTARAFLPKQIPEMLFHYSLIQGGVVGYISTQFGAGFEYIGAESSGIKVHKSSARVENFFTGAPARIRKLPVMFRMEGSDITLAYLTLEGGFPFHLLSSEASVRFIYVRFTALGWSREVKYAELFGNRTAEFWSEPNAVRKAIRRVKDDIFLAQLDLREAEKRSISLVEYLRTFKEKTVLVLGDFSSAGRNRLIAIKEALDNLGYAPILLDEVPDDPHYDLQQKGAAVGSVVRFVVIDDSSKSGHLVEFPHVQANRWVTIVLRLEGSDGSFMTHGASAYSTVITERTYSPNTLHETLRESVQWAEDVINDLKIKGLKLYPWRADL